MCLITVTNVKNCHYLYTTGIKTTVTYFNGCFNNIPLPGNFIAAKNSDRYYNENRHCSV